MTLPAKNTDTRVVGIYEKGISLTAHGRQYFVQFDEHKELEIASTKNLFDIVLDNGSIRWQSLNIEISLRDLNIKIPKQRFSYPRVNQYVLISVIIIGTIFLGFVSYSIIFNRVAAGQIRYAWLTGGILSLANTYLVFVYSVISQTIRIDDHGIAATAPNGKSTIISWNDIVKIKKCKLENDIKISSHGAAAIRINQLIYGFDHIVNIARSKTGLDIEN